jgi:hypothetical protein
MPIDLNRMNLARGIAEDPGQGGPEAPMPPESNPMEMVQQIFDLVQKMSAQLDALTQAQAPEAPMESEVPMPQ